MYLERQRSCGPNHDAKTEQAPEDCGSLHPGQVLGRQEHRGVVRHLGLDELPRFEVGSIVVVESAEAGLAIRATVSRQVERSIDFMNMMSVWRSLDSALVIKLFGLSLY